MRLFLHSSAAFLLMIGPMFARAQSAPDPRTTTHQNFELKNLLTAPVYKISGVFTRNNSLHPNARLNQNYISVPAAPLAFTSPVFNQSVADAATLIQTS